MESRGKCTVKPKKAAPAAPSIEGPCLCVTDPCIVNPTQGSPRIIIVGGGLSGLSAAARLLACGIKDVLVLEAADRAGGKVQSCWLGDTVVELGNQTLNSANVTNSIYNMAIAEDITLSEPPNENVEGVFLTSDGRAIASYPAEKMLFQHILRETSGLSRDDKTSLLHFLGLRIQQEILNYPPDLRYDAERVLYGMTNELRGRWGAELSELSAPMFTTYRELPGVPLFLPQGNVSILTPLIAAIPYTNILYGKKVKSIEWSPSPTAIPRVRVYTEDDCYIGDYAIITLPMGVLKETAKSMFMPPLPETKLNAISSIGVGLVNRVFAEYAEPWWGSMYSKLRLAWSSNELISPGDWTRGLSSIQSLSRYVISFSISGPEALAVETCSEEEVAIEFTRFVRKLTGDMCLPFPHHIIVTRWGNNCLYKGSALYMGVNTTLAHFKHLAQPVPGSTTDNIPTLFFAGEATEARSFGSLHAARVSGLREADRILDITRKLCGPPAVQASA